MNAHATAAPQLVLIDDDLYNEEYSLYEHVGVIPIFPPAMVRLPPNDTSCLCSDLQTEDYSPIYGWFNWVLIILGLPHLSVFGVLTNIINVYVYSRSRMSSSANTYLLFLSCSDFMVILTGVFIFWIDSARSYIDSLSRAPYTTVYALPFGYMAQTCSIYFTVAAAVDCYVSVCWRSVRSSYCTVRRARIILICIIVLSIAYNSLRFPQFNLRRCLHQGSNEFVIEICPTTLFYTINTIYNVYMYMVLMTLLPFMFLLVLNAFIVVKQSIQAATKSATQSNGTTATVAVEASGSHVPLTTKTSTTLSEAPVSSDDTITMIAVVLLFLFCNTLALVVNIIETFFEPDALLLNMLTDLSNFLVIFNSSVNCVIYFIFNKEYRETFHEMVHTLCEKFCSCCRRHRRPASDQQLFCKMPISHSTDGSPPTAIMFDQRRVQNNTTSGKNGTHESNLPSRHVPGRAPEQNSPIWQRLRLPNGNVDAYWNGGFAETSLGLSAASIRASVMSGFEELCADLVPMDECDEGDSGWDDEFLSNGNQTPLPGSRLSRLTTMQPASSQPTHSDGCQSWIAEVQIMDNRPSGRPHIYVKPISKYVAPKMSITAL